LQLQGTHLSVSFITAYITTRSNYLLKTY